MLKYASTYYYGGVHGLYTSIFQFPEISIFKKFHVPTYRDSGLRLRRIPCSHLKCHQINEKWPLSDWIYSTFSTFWGCVGVRERQNFCSHFIIRHATAVWKFVCIMSMIYSIEKNHRKMTYSGFDFFDFLYVVGVCRSTGKAKFLLSLHYWWSYGRFNIPSWRFTCYELKSPKNHPSQIWFIPLGLHSGGV